MKMDKNFWVLIWKMNWQILNFPREVPFWEKKSTSELREYVRDEGSDHYLWLSKWNITQKNHETKKAEKVNETINPNKLRKPLVK